MNRYAIMTALVALSALFAAPARAGALPVHCVEDAGVTRCEWSVVQPVQPLLEVFGSGDAQPVPLCLDCAPTEVEMLCTLVQRKGEAPVTHCASHVDDMR